MARQLLRVVAWFGEYTFKADGIGGKLLCPWWGGGVGSVRNVGFSACIEPTDNCRRYRATALSECNCGLFAVTPPDWRLANTHSRPFEQIERLRALAAEEVPK